MKRKSQKEGTPRAITQCRPVHPAPARNIVQDNLDREGVKKESIQTAGLEEKPEKG